MKPNFKLLQYLQKHPTDNFSQIAEKLSMSDKTAKSHYDFLLREGYISGVRAKYIPESIGLETQTYILSVPDIKKVLLLEELADEHYFTTFRNRILGHTQGLFMQFDLPKDSVSYLDDLMIKLEELNVLERFEKLPSTGFKISTSVEFEIFNKETNEWNWLFNEDSNEWTWDFEKWEKDFTSCSEKLTDKKTTVENVRSRIKELDINLLADITKESKYYHKQLDFAKKYNVSPVQITRRLNFLNNQVVNYRLLYSRAKIQAVDLVVFRGKCIGQIKNKLYNMINSFPVPFDSGFEILEDGFIWRMNIPPAYSSAFGEFLWKSCSRLNYYKFDHTKSKLYYFYKENFDLNRKEWIATPEIIYEEPLKWIRKQL
jgi:DNA-binding Lrp family transcriptional regulator